MSTPNSRTSKYDAFTYGQLYAHYDSVVQVSQSVKPSSAQGIELQHALHEIRAALHEKAQERIRVWNGTTSAKDTVCPNLTAAPEKTVETLSTQEPDSVGVVRATKGAKRKTSHTAPARNSRQKNSPQPKTRPHARSAKSSTPAAHARARSKRR